MKRKILFMFATSLLFTLAWRAQALPRQLYEIHNTTQLPWEQTFFLNNTLTAEFLEKCNTQLKKQTF